VGLEKTTKNLSQNSRSPGQDLNPGPFQYEAGVLSTRLWRSANQCVEPWHQTHIMGCNQCPVCTSFTRVACITMSKYGQNPN